MFSLQIWKIISVKVSAKGWYQHFWFPYRTIVQYSPKLWQHQEYLPISKHKLEKRCPGIHSWNLTLAVGLQMKLHVQLFLKIENFLTHKILLFWSQYVNQWLTRYSEYRCTPMILNIWYNYRWPNIFPILGLRFFNSVM